MQEFDAISKKYHQAGISMDNLEYAVSAVKFGSSPDQIIENLKVGYRSLNDEEANALLQDLFIANKIEMRRRKKSIILLGSFYLLAGFVCTYYILHELIFGGKLHQPLFMILAALSGIIAGLYCFVKSFKIDSVNAVKNRLSA